MRGFLKGSMRGFWGFNEGFWGFNEGVLGVQ